MKDSFGVTRVLQGSAANNLLSLGWTLKTRALHKRAQKETINPTMKLRINFHTFMSFSARGGTTSSPLVCLVTKSILDYVQENSKDFVNLERKITSFFPFQQTLLSSLEVPTEIGKHKYAILNPSRVCTRRWKNLNTFNGRKHENCFSSSRRSIRNTPFSLPMDKTYIQARRRR